MSKKILLATLLLGAFLSLGLVAQASTSSLTAAETVANLATGVNNQEVASSTLTENVIEVKASTTLTVGTLPLNNTTITVGGCVITFFGPDSVNCSGGTAMIATSTDGGTTGRTPTQIATALQSLIYVKNPVASSSSNIIVSASSSSATSVVFTTAASSTETGGKILFTDGTSGKVTNPYSYAGVAPVAQVDVLTFSGTIEENDEFHISGVFNYTVLSTDDTWAKVAAGLRATHYALVGDPVAGEGDLVTSVSDDTLRVTANDAGTPIDAYNATTTNRSARAQVVTFTPANVTGGETFRIIINGSIHSYLAASGDTVATVVAGLVSSASTDASVDCVNTTNTKVTCTAKVAGNAFTGTAEVVSVSTNSGGISSLYSPAPVSPSNIASLSLTRAWAYGKTHKEIKLLQEKLKTLGYIKKTQKTTTYFGLVTKAALIKFQKANKIKPANGVLNVKTRALLNK